MEEHQKPEPKKPDIAVSYNKSKDGKYIIVTTKITDIKPIKYFEKVLESPQEWGFYY